MLSIIGVNGCRAAGRALHTGRSVGVAAKAAGFSTSTSTSTSTDGRVGVRGSSSCSERDDLVLRTSMNDDLDIVAKLGQVAE